MAGCCPKRSPAILDRDEIAVINRIRVKGRQIIILASLQKKALDQLHISYRGIEKTRLLACESIYRININADAENAVENCPIYLNFCVTQPKDKTLSRETPGRLWESVRTEILQSVTSIIFVL